MPIAACQEYVKNLLNDLPMPGSYPNLACYITAPDPNVEAEIPTAYVWPTNGAEKRDPRNAGTMPRNTGPGTPSGFKTISHSIGIWVVWFGADDDQDADNAFPGMVDAIMFALRTAAPDPAIVTDPYTGEETMLADTGEEMTYQTNVSAIEDQRWNRYDALIKLPITEVIQA
ncbi:MAG TPA: hypothetical protein VGD68_18160 [Streptosporangiaceae bacterium]